MVRTCLHPTIKKNLNISTQVDKQVRKDLLRHRMDHVVISVMCLSMHNTGMENDGKYETDFFFKYCDIQHESSSFQAFIYTEGIWHSLEPDNM